MRMLFLLYIYYITVLYKHATFTFVTRRPASSRLLCPLTPPVSSATGWKCRGPKQAGLPMCDAPPPSLFPVAAKANRAALRIIACSLPAFPLSWQAAAERKEGPDGTCSPGKWAVN